MEQFNHMLRHRQSPHTIPVIAARVTLKLNFNNKKLSMVMDVDVMLMHTMNGMVVCCQHKLKGSFMGNCTILKPSPLSSLTTKAHATIIQ